MSRKDQVTWEEAQSRCKLSADDVRMAKELGFQPRALVKNIPAPTERWKMPVAEWVRQLHERKFGSAAATPAPGGFREAILSWPDNPVIPPLRSIEFEESDDYGLGFDNSSPSADEVEEQNALMLRGQAKFRAAAQLLALGFREVTAVQRVECFGAVARPLVPEVPRFYRFRRQRVEVLHECADVDLAIWMSDLRDIKRLKTVRNKILGLLANASFGGVANHQVDIHLLDAATGDYCGRVCQFGQCPKDGKPQCRVKSCGTLPFVQIFDDFRWNRSRFEGELRVLLLDRPTGFLTSPPTIEFGDFRMVPIKSTEGDAEIPF